MFSRYMQESIKTASQAIAAARAVQEARLLIDDKESKKLLVLELWCWERAELLRKTAKPRGARLSKEAKS